MAEIENRIGFSSRCGLSGIFALVLKVAGFLEWISLSVDNFAAAE